MNTPTLSNICIAAIEDILEAGETSGDDDFVHQTRVLTKRLRAAWKLVKGVASVEKVKARRAALRDISAHYSGSRDQAVLRDLCGSLAEEGSDDQARALRSVGTGIELADSRRKISHEELAKQFEEEKQAWLSLDWSHQGECQEIVNQRIGQSYRKARKATREAVKTVCSETWHTWRKALKQLRYQREFLAEMEGRPLTDFEMEVKDLGSLLGHRNDLANLEKYIASKGADSIGDRAYLKSAIGQSTAEIMEKCSRLGKNLLGNKTLQ